MTIQFKLKDDHARYAEYILRKRFGSKAKLDQLAKRLLIDEVAALAKRESDIADAELNEKNDGE